MEKDIKILKLDKLGIDFIAKEEGGFKLKPYLDIRGIPTISAGVTYYGDGTKVAITDKEITQERAEQLFDNVLKDFETSVANDIKTRINQNQFNALVSLSYNIGTGGFKVSTVLKLVNRNTQDPDIINAFKMWRKAGNSPNALLGRRIREAKLYFNIQ